MNQVSRFTCHLLLFWRAEPKKLIYYMRILGFQKLEKSHVHQKFVFFQLRILCVASVNLKLQKVPSITVYNSIWSNNFLRMYYVINFCLICYECLCILLCWIDEVPLSSLLHRFFCCWFISIDFYLAHLLKENKFLIIIFLISFVV